MLIQSLAAVKRLYKPVVFQFFHKPIVDQLRDVHFLCFRSAHRNGVAKEPETGHFGVRNSLDDAVAQLLPQRAQHFFVMIARVLFQSFQRALAVGRIDFDPSNIDREAGQDYS